VIRQTVLRGTGRVISLARLVLAAVFLVAVWADPSQPSLYPAAAYAVLAAYVAMSAAYALLIWDNWWLENRTALIAHLLDIGLFGVMVFLTQGYTSPFFTFFVFIVFAASVRWDWRGTAATAAAVMILFGLAGLAATDWQMAYPDLTRLIIRGIYLLILSLVMIWFGLYEQERYRSHYQPALLANPALSDEPPISAALGQLARRTGAVEAAILWWEEEEPWLHLMRIEKGVESSERLPPDAFGDIVDPGLRQRTFLFDDRRGHLLVYRGRPGAPVAGTGPALDGRLRAHLNIENGLAVGIENHNVGAIMIAGTIAGMSVDDLETGARIGMELAAALQRSASARASQEAAAAASRLALARDIHDGVVQLLAGTALRLQGLRQAIRSGQDVDGDIQSLQQDLAAEQRELRSLIGGLRSSGGDPVPPPLREVLEDTLDRLCKQWSISCGLDACPGQLRLPPTLEHEVKQLMREAVANAVKHGAASEVRITVAESPGELTLTVRDNGSGFPMASGKAGQGPWSLNERVHDLNGTLMFARSEHGSEIVMTLPWEGRA